MPLGGVAVVPAGGVSVVPLGSVADGGGVAEPGETGLGVVVVWTGVPRLFVVPVLVFMLSPGWKLEPIGKPVEAVPSTEREVFTRFDELSTSRELERSAWLDGLIGAVMAEPGLWASAPPARMAPKVISVMKL